MVQAEKDNLAGHLATGPCSNKTCLCPSSCRRVKMYSVVGFIVNVLRLNLVFSKWILYYKYNGL